MLAHVWGLVIVSKSFMVFVGLILIKNNNFL